MCGPGHTRVWSEGQPADDHDLHMQVHPNGNLEPTTNCVKYTSDRLKLWRDQLVYYRVEIIRCSQEASRIRTLLESVAVPDDYRLLLEGLLREMDPWLNPPVFSRPRQPRLYMRSETCIYPKQPALSA